MGKEKKKITALAPTFQSDPRFQGGIDQLVGLGSRLSSFDLTGDLSPLADTIALDPEVTKLALAQAASTLGPQFEDTLNQIKQEAVNANQFESSTFANAIVREGGRLNQQFQGITAGAALEDRSRALANRLGIVQLGAGLTAQGTGLAGQNQNALNDFAQRNFENQVALQTANQKDKGGLFGGLMGGAGGALAGLALAPFTGGSSLLLAGGGALAGGALGALGPSGTGGQVLNAGGSLLGGFGSKATPRSSAGALERGTGMTGGVSTSRLLDPDIFKSFALGV